MQISFEVCWSVLMAPHYERPQSPSETMTSPRNIGSAPDEDAMEDAAEALRQVEVEAVQPDPDVSSLSASQLDEMSIDELRAVARVLDVPERSKITEQDELIEAIRRRLPR
jgi:hypothetical protein